MTMRTLTLQGRRAIVCILYSHLTRFLFMKKMLHYLHVPLFPSRIIGSILLTAACAAWPLAPLAQEKGDTATVDLKEVVVEGQMQRATAEKVTYKPSTRVKNASQNAIELLKRMAISQLNADDVAMTVKTAVGEDVSLFINYAPATPEDIQGMRMSDVRSVEYLDFPTDPRFRGARHAVNIIVQEYEYGGYTKISDRQFLLQDFSNQASLFSKFAFRKMTYDLYVAANNVSSSHLGQSQTTTFSLPSGDVTRKQEFLSSDFKHVSIPATFRAVYSTDRLRISNTIGYSFNDRYRSKSEGRLLFEPANGADYTYEDNTPYVSSTLSWKGDYYFSLPKGWSLTADPSFVYTHRNSYSSYSTSAPGSDHIVNDARENAYQVRLGVNARKVFNGIHTLSADVSGEGSINNVRYYGSSPYDSDFSSYIISSEIGYTLGLQKFRLDASVTLAGNFIKTNGEKYNDLYPVIHLSGTYAPTQKNYMSLSLNYGTSSPQIAEHSPNVIQVNELLFRTGNPLIKNNRYLGANANYTFLPSNKFSVTAYASYYGSYNRAVATYELYDNGRGVIRSYRNSGDFTVLNFGVNAVLRLFGNSLIFQASPYFGRSISTGYIDDSKNVFAGTIAGQYYIGNFNIIVGYTTRYHNLYEKTGVYLTNRSSYYLQAGWSKNSWNLSVSVHNPFRSRYDGSWAELHTPIYSVLTTTFNGNYRRALGLSATYTFGYGKKVSRGDEVGSQSDAGSAIM